MPIIRLKKNRSGQSLIETLAGFMLLIPLALFSYDLTFILVSSQTNERLAENAARAAANHATNLAAQQAAQQAIDGFNQSSADNNVNMTDFDFNDNGQVSLVTQMNIKLPVPFVSWKNMVVRAHAVVPVVAYPAPI